MPGFAAIAGQVNNIIKGLGVPAAGVGANSDWFQRLDAPDANNAFYVKIAGAWVAGNMTAAGTSLDGAYDFGGPGLGRAIVADAGVVLVSGGGAAGNISSPGAGAGSETFGDSAVSAGASGSAFGNAASASATQGSCFGKVFFCLYGIK